MLNDTLSYTQTGTPYYASPEVWRDEPYDYKSDVWSLGCVLYEMTALRPPFKAKDMSQLYERVIKGEYPDLPHMYSKSLNLVIRSMLQVNPKKRPSCKKLLNSSLMRKKIDQYLENYKNMTTMVDVSDIRYTNDMSDLNSKILHLFTIF